MLAATLMVNSIRFRLTMWFVGVLAIVILLFSGGSYIAVTRMIAHEADQRLVDAARSFEAAVNAESAEQQTAAPSEQSIREAVDETRAQDYSITVIDNRGIVMASSADAPPPASLPDGFSDVTLAGTISRAYVSPLKTLSGDARVVVSRSRQDQISTAETFRTVMIAGIVLAILLSSVGGYILSRKSLAPMIEIGKQAGQIGSSNLGERLTARYPDDELGQLVEAFNKLLERLESSFDQQRRFMADASHELRTPIAVLLGESEVALSKEDRPTAEYIDSLRIVREESGRLTSIVDDLFILARADAGQAGGRFEDVYIDEIVTAAATSMRVLARKKEIELEVECGQELPAKGDPQLLGRMLLSVLDNAIKYTDAGGRITLACDTSGEVYSITITDSGIGIPHDQQPFIFDRFFRVDKARSRAEAGGAGLGLSIAKWIADLHGGDITLVKSDTAGTAIMITLPKP